MVEHACGARRCSMIHSIVHFEVPADDVERAKKFYEQLFGWGFQAPQEGYHVIDTGEGGVGGGMMQRPVPEHGITIYISVESVDEYLTKVESLGGTVVMPKTAVPTMGYFAHFLDSEGNALAIWEENPAAQ
jgi:predicted enzyme related to lactoylglutathione lyase